MMPSEDTDSGSYKIVFEIDYSHFVTIHGWLYLVQLVRHWPNISANDPDLGSGSKN